MTIALVQFGYKLTTDHTTLGVIPVRRAERVLIPTEISAEEADQAKKVLRSQSLEPAALLALRTTLDLWLQVVHVHDIA